MSQCMSSKRPLVISFAKLVCNFLKSSLSASTAITFLALFNNSLVSMPVPGPISNTVSSLVSFATRAILSAMRVCIRKFCPSDFLARMGVYLYCMEKHHLTLDNFDRGLRETLRYKHRFEHADLERAKGIIGDAIEHVEHKTGTSSGMGAHHLDTAM